MAPALLALAAATGLYAFWLCHTPLGVGWYRDDGVYVVTARAMADGRGPRLDYLPGAPRMTKYPLLWPGVLAGLIAVADPDRERLIGPLVVLPNAVFLPLALLAFAAIVGRSRRLPAAAAALLVLAVGEPSVLDRPLPDETLYLALTLGAIALADAAPDQAIRRSWGHRRQPGRGRLRAARGAAIVIALATLAGPPPLRGLRLDARSRRGDLAAWGSYLNHAAIVDAAAHAEPLFAYDLSYGALPGGTGGFLRAVIHDAPPAAYWAACIALGGSARGPCSTARPPATPHGRSPPSCPFAAIAAAGIAARAGTGQSRYGAPRPSTSIARDRARVARETFRLLVARALADRRPSPPPRPRGAATSAMTAGCSAIALAGWRHNLPPPGHSGGRHARGRVTRPRLR
jgi:hypothetical protein